jgi:hypothetical protein
MDTKIEKSLRHEAQILGYYLIKENPREHEILLYLKATQELQLIPESSLDQRILELVLKNPWMMGFFDGGLSFLNPDSIVRRKILAMLAIIEASPCYYKKFLPERHKKVVLLALIPRIFISFIKTAIGFIALKSYGILWR